MESEQFTNLTVHRSTPSAWKRHGLRYLDDRNVGWLVSAAGAGLLFYGIDPRKRRTSSSLWWILSGAALLGFAATRSRYALERFRSRPDLAADVVTQESLDSFPASDAPSSNATTATAFPSSGDRDGFTNN